MSKPLIKLKTQINRQIKLINSPKIDILDKITLTRSLLENYSILNFLTGHDSAKRIELFQCFGEFEWYSHQIYESHPVNQRVNRFKAFLIKIKQRYPYGYRKYGRLIKRRLCKQLRHLIKTESNHKPWRSELDLINSDKPADLDHQLTLMARYMSHHLITKLPFPYRVVFGKSITYFVLKYSKIDRSTYWLLADLSHGTLIGNHLSPKPLIQRIQKILQIIDSKVNLR